jgi:hypothetical protein
MSHGEKKEENSFQVGICLSDIFTIKFKTLKIDTKNFSNKSKCKSKFISNRRKKKITFKFHKNLNC